MPFWSLKKNKETPKKESKPTEEALLKRDNCKTLTLKDGSSFILVGGTHSAELDYKFHSLFKKLGIAYQARYEKDIESKNYELVKDLLGGVKYDTICVELLTLEEYDPESEVELIKKIVGRIKEDEELWKDIESLFAKISSESPALAEFLSGKEIKQDEIDSVRAALEKIDGLELPERSRRKLSKLVGAVLKRRNGAKTKGVYEKYYLQTHYLSNSIDDILLSKAVKDRTDFVLCDIVDKSEMAILYSISFHSVRFFLVFLLVPWEVSAAFLAFVFSSLMWTRESNRTYIDSKHGKAFVRVARFLSALSLTPAYLINKYREALTAFQLLKLAEAFKKKQGRPGTFLYWSHVVHTEGVFSNLKLGRETLEKKLKSRTFAFFRPFYRDYLLIETNEKKLSEDRRINFLDVAKKAGIPVDEL